MDFLELCTRRQSCRDYTSKPVEHEKLLRCVEAARLAPSGCNAQPWSFVVVESPQAVAQVAQATQQLELNAYTDNVKAFVVVLEEHARLMAKMRRIFDSQYFAKGDLGAAIVCIALQAEQEGLGSVILGVFDREKLAGALNLPIEQRIAAVVAIGYPADETVRAKKRKPMEEIVRFV